MVVAGQLPNSPTALHDCMSRNRVDIISFLEPSPVFVHAIHFDLWLHFRLKKVKNE